MTSLSFPALFQQLPQVADTSLAHTQEAGIHVPFHRIKDQFIKYAKAVDSSFIGAGDRRHPQFRVGDAIDPLYDPPEAAEYLGIKESTLAVWRCVGRYGIEYVKVGRLVKYRKSALDAFIKRRTHSQVGQG